MHVIDSFPDGWGESGELGECIRLLGARYLHKHEYGLHAYPNTTQQETNSSHNWQGTEILSNPALCRWKTEPQDSLGRRLS